MPQNMKQKKQTAAREENNRFGAVNPVIVAASTGALLATFSLGFADIGFIAELLIFIAILVAYLAVCTFLYFHRKSNYVVGETSSSTLFDDDVENRLRALEDASRFFGASLKPADMFRLITSRVNELVPCAACALYCVSENGTRLKIEYADGESGRALKNFATDARNGLAGKALISRRIEFDENLTLEKTAIPPALLANFQSAAAVPLIRQNKVFAVFLLYFNELEKCDDRTRTLLDAVGERIAPLMASSMSFENSLSNALTDELTNLPNQRAFFLVLENQIAESVRYQSERALSMLAIDIKNFDDLNRKFGHASADRILAFAGENIKTQLRQMDFLARSGSDEFLAVLPTAEEKVAVEIIERLRRAFAEKYFDLDEKEKVFVELNFGAATFGSDGETAQQLLQTAVLRKHQRKSNDSGKVLWFPKEFVN